VFGCKAHVRPASPHLKKLDDRSVPMVYLGVEEGSKAHRLYNPQTKRIVVSRDVVFEESVAWEWNAEFGQNSDFDVEETVEATVQPFVVGNNDADLDGDSQANQPQNDSGGVSDGLHDAGLGGDSVQQGGNAMSDSDHG
jgi:hypothetical protein